MTAPKRTGGRQTVRRTSGRGVRFGRTGTHSWSRTNRTDRFFPIGCPLVRKRRFNSRSGHLCPLLSAFVRFVGNRARELILGSHRFKRSSAGCQASRARYSLLASRLRDLEDSGVVERLPRAKSKLTEYRLSERGRDLKTVVEALGAWGVRWAYGEPKPEELDAGLLVWKIHQRIDCELLPETRTVVEFDFKGNRGRRVWLLLQRREVSVCVTPPGFDSDLVVRADLAYFYRVWLGHIEYDAAIRCGGVVVQGTPALAKQLSRWFMWSPMAHLVRERERAPARRSAASRN